MIKKAEECCSFILGAIEGAQGFLTEVISLILFIIIFNFLAKWLLDRLANYFEKKEKSWHEGLIRAFTLPLTAYAWFFAFLHAVELIGKHFFSTNVFDNLHLLLKIGGVIAFIWFLLRWKKNIVKIMIKKSKNHEISIEPGKLDVINKITTVALFFLAFLMLLEVTHSSLNTLIAFGGIGGLALAFASQEIIANFFSGAMIYLTQPFLLGDLINVPEKNIEGYVEEIGWYMTRIRTIDKRPVYIPNSIFSKIIVITPSRMTHRQFKETFGLRYEDMPKVAPLIRDVKEMLENHPEVDKRQRIAVYLNTFATYSLDILISAYTKTTSTDAYFELRQSILLSIYQLIEKHGAKAAVPITYVKMAALPPLELKREVN
ncbi:MAG TPA: mechanosensitive ion channel family protein [Parachlamydiaceae bacterium]|nr:mechanosensitive ion channel family protein [Parachlamydiaceae bacterium]